MSKPILVGLDIEREDVAPLRLGVALARITGRPLVAVAAYLHGPITNAVSGPMVQEDLKDFTLRELAALTAGTDAELMVIGGLTPAGVLHDAAVRLDASMIVVGSTTKGRLGRVAPGATAARLLHVAPCAVAVATTALAADWQPQRVGAAFIDLEDGREALRVAAALTHAAGGTLFAATAIEPIQWSQSAVVAPYRTDGRLDSSKAAAKRALDNAIGRLPVKVPASSDVLVGRASDALTALSGDVDLLVCGSRGYGPVRSALLGSVSRRVIKDARCPVIVVPHAGAQALDAPAQSRTTAA